MEVRRQLQVSFLALAALLGAASSVAVADYPGKVPAGTVLGNATAGTAAPVAVPASGPVLVSGGILTARTFSSTLSGVVPASGGGTTNFLRADGNWTAALSGACATTFTAGGVLYGNGTGCSEDATNFFWDATNRNLQVIGNSGVIGHNYAAAFIGGNFDGTHNAARFADTKASMDAGHFLSAGYDSGNSIGSIYSASGDPLMLNNDTGHDSVYASCSAAWGANPGGSVFCPSDGGGGGVTGPFASAFGAGGLRWQVVMNSGDSPTETFYSGITSKVQVAAAGLSYFRGGDIQLGGTSAVATSATSGFPYVATTAGTPTGVPGNAAAGQSAVVVDSTGHQLCWYEQANAAWKCAGTSISTPVSPANGGTGVNNSTNTLTLAGNTALPAAPGSTQCLHMSNTGAITATGSDCGSASAPTPAEVFISTASGTSLHFASLTSASVSYHLKCRGLVPSTNTAVLYMRVGSATKITTGYQVSGSYVNSAGSGGNVGNTTDVSLINVITLSSTGTGENLDMLFNNGTNMHIQADGKSSDGNYYHFVGQGSLPAAASFTDLYVEMSTGNIASGNCSLYSFNA